MTKHLTPQELVDAVDETLGAVRLRHVETCERCAAALESLRTGVVEIRAGAHVPEPSPLFWDHFSARVQAATAETPLDDPDWWGRLWRPALALGALGLVALVGVSMRPQPLLDVPAAEGTVVAVGEVASPGGTSDPVQVVDSLVERGAAGETGGAPIGAPSLGWSASAALDEAWIEVAEAAGQLGFVGVEALVPAETATLLLVEDLNETELEEFARLLRTEMGGGQ